MINLASILQKKIIKNRAEKSKTALYGFILFLFLCVILQAVLLLFILPVHFSSASNQAPEDLTLIDAQTQYFKNEIESLGPEQAYKKFIAKTINSPITQQHESAHLFGRALYQASGIKGANVCDNSFAYGCFHSFFAMAIKDNGPQVIYDLDEVCNKKYGTGGLGCNHGIGHGIMYELGEDKLLDALNMCKTLSWKGSLGGCTSGVFMEFNLNTMNNPQANLAGIRPPKKDLHFPCGSIPNEFRIACYFEQPQWWLITFSSDEDKFTKSGALCEEIANSGQREICYKGIGNIAAPTSKYEVNQAIKACNSITSREGRIFCYAGAAWSFEAELKNDKYTDQICGTLGNEQKICKEEARIISI